ncbi:MAG TPA: adenylate/guanylate cyclase domain-containing protein, partial [Candidatus Ozemobacteraceae bacterium]|nr:adenylate/guanylate cyclase domain-containing protein [Candidatus Ozemobacteraceae bacterium]
MTFRFRTFKARLLTIFLSLFVLVGIAAFLLVHRVSEQYAREQAERSLEVSGRVLSETIRSRGELLRQAVYMLSRDFAFQQAFATDDLATVRSAMLSLKSRLKADLMLLSHPEEPFATVVETENLVEAGTPFPGSDMIHAALESEKPVSGILELEGRLFITIVVPLLAPEPIAWFVVGFQIDDTFVRELQTITNTDLSVIVEGSGTARLHASTLSETQRASLMQVYASFNHELEVSKLQLGGDPWLLRSIRVGHTRMIRLILGKSLSRAMAPFYQLRMLLFSIALIGLVITIIGVFLVARHVTVPLRALVDKTRLIEEGTYDQPIVVTQEDEIGDLARAYNHMSKGLADRDKVRALLGKVVSGAIADELLKSGEVQLGGEEKEVTILFSDIRNFTTLCEGRAPSQILEMLNDYLTRMNQVIEAHGGVVDKFIGDAIMALFGAPVPHPDDVDRALRAALQMKDELAQINVELAKKNLPQVSIGIGINTGVVVAGNMG